MRENEHDPENRTDASEVERADGGPAGDGDAPVGGGSAADLATEPVQGRAHAVAEPAQGGAHASTEPAQGGAHASTEPAQGGAHASTEPAQGGAHASTEPASGDAGVSDAAAEPAHEHTASVPDVAADMGAHAGTPTNEPEPEPAESGARSVTSTNEPGYAEAAVVTEQAEPEPAHQPAAPPAAAPTRRRAGRRHTGVPAEIPHEPSPDEPDDEPDERAEPVAPRLARGRTVLRRVGATTSALVVLAAAAGAVVAGQYFAPPEATAVPATRVDVPAGPVSAVCAAPPALTAGAGMSVGPEVDPAAVTPATRTQLLTLPRAGGSPAEATYTPLGGGAPQALDRAGQVRAALTDPAGVGVLTAQPVDGVTALMAGATVARTDAGDLRGLTAAACQAPASTTWLVGGGTEPGQSAQLQLTNPGQTPATVDVTLWTSLGLVDAPRLSDIVVAPRSSTAVLLEGATTGDPRLALRVEASGGEVTAAVQDLQLNGVVPAGIDAVTPTRAPALHLAVPGVVLGESGVDDAVTSAVRLVNPGESTATASVRLLGADGEQALPGAESVALDPGAVMDLSLTGVAPGVYAVEITADNPVTGAVVLARTGQAGALDPDVAPVDRAWTAAAEPVRTGTLMVPGLGQLVSAATVALTNPAADATTVELVPVTARGAAGEAVQMRVPARSTVSTAVAQLGQDVIAVQVSAEDGAGGSTGSAPAASAAGVVAAVVLTAQAADGELISVLPLTTDPHDARSVRVDVR
ncbi:DUF5719 family protein [Georgenia sp. SYP-B2076]|uniref:DUF5719 family protein n=1 Tax=Georgenia sp. SYP-B2076 TaxID=2495881 RepID=UPI000F8E1CE4|nr:DUF5719 family protein [Georgenia sp. SYP-B2076]